MSVYAPTYRWAHSQIILHETVLLIVGPEVRASLKYTYMHIHASVHPSIRHYCCPVIRTCRYIHMYIHLYDTTAALQWRDLQIMNLSNTYACTYMHPYIHLYGTIAALRWRDLQIMNLKGRQQRGCGCISLCIVMTCVTKLPRHGGVNRVLFHT